MAAVPEYSDTNSSKAHGRGIVFASGPANFNTMLVAIRMMRSMGCKVGVVYVAHIWDHTHGAQS